MFHHFRTGRPHGSRPPHRPTRRTHNHTVESLNALIRAGLIADMAALVTAADEIDQTGTAGSYLRGLRSDAPPPLAVRMLDAHQQAEAVAAYERALGYASSGRVVFVCPVPPHFFDDFAWGEGAVALRVDHHDLPPSIRHAGTLPVCGEFHAALALVEKADAVMLDVYREGGTIWMRNILIALLDERHLRAETKLLAHSRRHPDPTDVAAPPELAARIEFI
jgi:hypothetical protein